jgi:hypothetical protein
MSENVHYIPAVASDFTPPPNILAVAKQELTEEQFERFCVRISPLIGAAYVQFIEGERNESRIRAATQS